MIEENQKADNNEDIPLKSDAVQAEPELTKITNEDNTPLPTEDAETDEPEKAEPVDSEPLDTASPPPTNNPVDATVDTENPTDEVHPETTPTGTTEPPVVPATESTETPVAVEVETPAVENNTTETTSEESKDDDKHEDHEELHEEDHEEEVVDYGQLTKEELQKAISEVSAKEDGFKKGKIIFAIKDAYDVIFNKEKEEALKKFVDDGGEEDDFHYHLDETSTKFEEYFKIIKGKRVKNARELEHQKDQNLATKTELLERLRVFVDDDENTASISAMKKMQEEWKNIGPVPHSQNRTLWANYNALMDRYYDHRSIYFELKELDRRKNLEAKLLVCQQAESLDGLDNLNEAIKKLNELHEEYKHIGPVPRESQEETWQRFKLASDKVYAKRKEYFSHLKESFQENYDKKILLADQAQSFADFTSETIGEWNSKSKEVMELQKQWETIGSMPKEKAKSVNKKFWGGFKVFFKHKSEFFKSLDSKREENLELKQALVDKANELKESTDWIGTTNAMKELQQKWKDIGPVPEKSREKIYKLFKAACDDFFNRRREHSKDQDSAYDGNLDKKKEICEKLEALAGIDDLNPESVYELQDEFNSIGFVPKKAIKSIQNRYQSALSAILSQAKNFDKDELDELKSLVSINKIKSGPHGDQKLQRKGQALKRKIQHLENDISIWKNNLGFFANSKNADQLLADFEEKIKKADAELAELKEELKLISYAG